MYDFNRNKEEEFNKTYSIIQKISSNNNKYELLKIKNKKTGEIYAAKIIKEYNNNILEKIKSLKKFENPYIVQFYNSFIINNNIWIITEFCDCGSVLDIMKITNKCYKESEIASIIVMVLKGLQFLHLQKKYHGGIKPSNILINNDGVVKLSDYNISNQLLNITNLTNNNNNIYKNPPELLNKNNYNNYNAKCDIWYLGLTCIELAEGSLSLNNKKIKEKNNNKNDNNNNNYIINNTNKSNNNLWSLEFIDFIQKCINENPMNRPSAASLLNHPFIINNNKGKIIIKKKIYNIKGLIDIYREKIDEQEEKININDNNYDIGKDSLEITSFNENLSLSQSDEINNNSNSNSNNYKIKYNMSLNINHNKNKSKNKSIVINNNKEMQYNKKIKIRKMKNSIKNSQIKNNNNNTNNKTNELVKKSRGHANSQVRNTNKNTSLLRKGKISLDIYEKNIISYNNNYNNNANGITSNDHLNTTENNNHNNNHHNNNPQYKRKRHSMVNKYIKNSNNKISQIRNDTSINKKINNTQENIYPKNNNIIKLLNKFEKETERVNKNANKSQRINRIQNVFFLTETPHNKKVKHKNNYSIKINNNNKHNNLFKQKSNKNNKSLSSIDSLRNSNKDKKAKNYNNNNNNNNIDKKAKSKTRNKKSNGGNQNLSELIESNKCTKKLSQKKNKLLRNLILNNSGKNIITDINNNNNNINKDKDMNNSKINSNEKIYNNKLNNSSNINNNKNIKKKEDEYKFPDININNINQYSKSPMVFYFKSGEIKRLKRPPLSHSSKKNNFKKKIKQKKKVSYKINTNNINNNIIVINDIHNKTNISINDNNNINNKTDYLDNINKNYDRCHNNNNQSYSYHRNGRNSLTEEEIKLLYLNGKLNERGLPELITELAGLENKMNQEIQKIKDMYEPIIKQHKEGIKFLKQNPFLKNLKEYKNYENFKKKMKLNSIDDMENHSISSSVHNLNKIKISFYQSNDIEELNISANKNIFDKTGYPCHGLIKI